jgi:predicted amidohydrolase YtcJ
MLIRGATLITGRPVDVRIESDVVIDIGRGLAVASGEEVVDAHGGTLLPGLHDHHLHLKAMAAATNSLHVGPSAVGDRDQLRAAIKAAVPDPDGWIRAVGYHDSVAGPLDRHLLDLLEPRRPLRVQHRSGAMWFVNTPGLNRLGMSDHPTGHIFRQDKQLAAHTATTVLDISGVSTRLCRYGITGVTDATPDAEPDDLEYLDTTNETGKFRQRIHVLNAPGTSNYRHLTFGPVKRILDDDSLDLTHIEQWIAGVHATRRPVAVHCVTAAQLIVTITALQTVGALPGDRIEHAAMVPDEFLIPMTELGVTVVTQPNFIAERGEQYLTDVPAEEHSQLWRLAALMDAAIPVAGSTDAPFGDPDPWACMRAARDRRTPTGRVIGSAESVAARTALNLFLGTPHTPATPRSVVAGMKADLCLLSAPPTQVLDELSADLVSATIIGGRLFPADASH